MNKIEILIGRLLYPEKPPPRPKTRAECHDSPRPCPWVGCRHHLYTDLGQGGGLTLRFPELEPWDMENSCSLDVADEREHTLQEVADLLGCTRENVRQIEARALRRLKVIG